MIDDIRELLAAPRPSETEPFLERLDTTLTDGYARALQLEAERWRIERQMAEIAGSLATESPEGATAELVALARRLSTTNEDISSLRALLTSLRERRTEIKTAQAA
jgi:ABC-type phosphate transport system auxiliary subunit